MGNGIEWRCLPKQRPLGFRKGLLILGQHMAWKMALRTESSMTRLGSRLALLTTRCSCVYMPPSECSFDTNEPDLYPDTASRLDKEPKYPGHCLCDMPSGAVPGVLGNSVLSTFLNLTSGELIGQEADRLLTLDTANQIPEFKGGGQTPQPLRSEFLLPQHPLASLPHFPPLQGCTHQYPGLVIPVDGHRGQAGPR